MDFHNGSNFIIKQLVKEFEGEISCLGKNTEKYKTFSIPIPITVPIAKEVKSVDQNREKIQHHIFKITIY